MTSEQEVKLHAAYTFQVGQELCKTHQASLPSGMRIVGEEWRALNASYTGKENVYRAALPFAKRAADRLIQGKHTRPIFIKQVSPYSGTIRRKKEGK